MDRSEIHTLVIGAGQAGLAMGYHLSKRENPFLLLEAHSRVGYSWRNRYDSLVLFTPRAYSSLPGLKLSGDPDGYPHKDEIADYLERYARHFQLPIRLGAKVEKIVPHGLGFEVTTNQGLFTVQRMIIATGPFQTPFIPDLPGSLNDDVMQLHTAHYRNPSQLNAGAVIVVGAGNSGVQIATELADDGREVYLSVGKPIMMLPPVILGKSLFRWLDILGISRLTVDSRLGQRMKKNDPIIGKEAAPYLQRAKVKAIPRTVGLEGHTLVTADSQRIQVQNVIWATGFRSDYSWVRVPGVLNGEGRPIHARGVTPYPGLHFLGLSWQHTLGSAILMGVGKDAEFLCKVMDGEVRQVSGRSPAEID